jgi:AraC family transcriptional regulator of adaptative response/methylated-DNA-[protein]-cysteine methyltransferase
MPRRRKDELMTATAQAAVQPQAINPDRAWQQLIARDRTAQFFYAVTTTGVFCRPGCSSRKPRRENVRFFATPADAARAGFRPCARCKPTTALGNSLDEIRTHIEVNLDRAIGLDELARIAGQSPFTVQRRFKQAFGVSPLQYQRALRSQRLRTALKQGSSVTDAIYDAGFGSSSRAYEGQSLGMSPARFAAGGQGERIGYATAASPFGWMVVGATERGLCWLALAGSEKSAAQTLRDEFPAAELHRDNSLALWIHFAVAQASEAAPKAQSAAPQVPLDLRGTVFQLRVWEALRRIPRGETRTYSQLAAQLGNPKATRAVARACATNRVAVLVPCHRVIGANGSATGYRWGTERKRRLLNSEQS